MTDNNIDESTNECDLKCDGTCPEGCDGCEGCEGGADDTVITLVDKESGESFEFAYVDSFDFNEKNYCVLLTLNEDPEMLIAEEIEDENGEITIATIDEEEADPIYDYYDSLCEEFIDDEDDAEE